jgi:selenocysteine lyase/cysteine desulfurase
MFAGTVRLGEQGIFVWDGKTYALEGKGGMGRIGAVHYDAAAEIRRLGNSLRGMASQS